MTVYGEDSGKEREASSAHVSLSQFFSRSSARATSHSGTPRAATAGPFLEMILVGGELWPLRCSLSMPKGTGEAEMPLGPTQPPFMDFSLLPALKRRCYSQPYSLSPPTLPLSHSLLWLQAPL